MNDYNPTRKEYIVRASFSNRKYVQHIQKLFLHQLSSLGLTSYIQFTLGVHSLSKSESSWQFHYIIVMGLHHVLGR